MDKFSLENKILGYVKKERRCSVVVDILDRVRLKESYEMDDIDVLTHGEEMAEAIMGEAVEKGRWDVAVGFDFLGIL